ncbi:rhomboid family intramembrane serine protease [Paenibacillus thailandensis]|uniref:Rhomboid family intramembrane serine protease n=1 Tax=Paenibacillus thailandensis TaxID=393250 RepID=A0ABW5R052_9BACL
MIFLRYESFRGYLKQYPVTSAIIAANLIYFIIVAIAGSTENAMHLLRYGAFYAEPGLDDYGLMEPYRYISSMFMHSGVQHLLFNMFALLVFAPPLERLTGHVRYAFFYLLCGVAANFASAFMTVQLDRPYVLSVGASGAIYGVYGAYLFLAVFRKSWLDAGSRKTVYMILASGLIYSFLIPTINVWAHIGGGVAGFLLFGLFDRLMTRKRRFGRHY